MAVIVNAATSIGSHGGTLSFSGTALVVTPGNALDQAHQFALQVPGTAVIDGSGNAYAGTSGNTDYHFTTGALDTTAPRVTLVDIADPVQPNAGTVSIRFSEAVQNVGISNFVLTRDGVPVDLSGLSVGGSGATYTLDLSSVTGTAGTYVLTLAPGSIQDSSGNALAAGGGDVLPPQREQVGDAGKGDGDGVNVDGVAEKPSVHIVRQCILVRARC